jgi:hypothetical protein
VALVGCQATARVTVTMNGAGAGSVAVALVLDHQAAARIGDVGSLLAVGDLQRQGWVLDPAVTSADGSVTATLHHSFANVASGQSLLDELGPVHLSLSRTRTLLGSRDRVSGVIDLHQGVDAFADTALASTIGAASLASALDQLHAAGAAVPSITVEVVARLPGHTATWSATPGQTQPVATSGSARNVAAVLWLAAAALLLIAAAVLSVRLLTGASR